jgi:mono/diheme cytochrome c family protein
LGTIARAQARNLAQRRSPADAKSAAKTLERKRAKLVWIAAVALGLGLAGVAARVVTRLVQRQNAEWVAPDSAPQMQNSVVVTAASLAAAKTVYENHCARCHGENGKGNGPDANLYAPAPQDFSNAKMQAASDGEIFWKISEGRRPMPGFAKDLSDETRWQLVNYLRSFAKPSAPAPRNSGTDP